MLVKTFGSAVYGVEAISITVEVNVSSGKFTSIVGLADNAVKESLERMESAIKTNGYHFPRTKVVVNLAPADIKNSGTAFDLPIAIQARKEKFKGLIVPKENAREAAMVNNLHVYGVNHINDVINFFIDEN